MGAERSAKGTLGNRFLELEVGEEIQVPLAWSQLTLSKLRGTLLGVGATDVGKTTFAQYLYSACVRRGSGWPTWTATRAKAPWDHRRR